MADSVRGAMESAERQKEARKQQMIPRVPPIKRIETAAERQAIDRAVAEVQQYIAAIPGHMTNLVTRMRRILGASPEEQTVCSNELKALRNEVLAHLNSEETLLRNAAVQAYAEALVATIPHDKRLVLEAIKGGDSLPGLLGVKILEPAVDEKGGPTVKVYGNMYKVCGGRDFAMKLAEALSEGAAKAAKAAHERYHSQVAVLKGQATISVADVLAEKPGYFFLDVPDIKEGEKFFSGGALLAKSDGKKTEVIQAAGHFQKILEEIRDARIFVAVESLKSGKLPYIPDKDEFRLVRTLLAVLRRGIAEAQARSEKEKVGERLKNLS